MTQRGAAGLHPSPDDDQNGRSTATMGFLDHLEEVRKRLIRSCVAVGVGMIVAWYFIDRIADFVLAQIVRTLPPGSELIYTNTADGFSFWFNLALIAGIRFAAPFVIDQVWGVIAPRPLRALEEVRHPVRRPDRDRHGGRRASAITSSSPA